MSGQCYLWFCFNYWLAFIAIYRMLAYGRVSVVGLGQCYVGIGQCYVGSNHCYVESGQCYEILFEIFIILLQLQNSLYSANSMMYSLLAYDRVSAIYNVISITDRPIQHSFNHIVWTIITLSQHHLRWLVYQFHTSSMTWV